MGAKLKYTGAGYGGSIHGVPARDLTEDDIEALSEKGHTIKSLVDSGFYKRLSGRHVAKSKAKAKEQEND